MMRLFRPRKQHLDEICEMQQVHVVAEAEVVVTRKGKPRELLADSDLMRATTSHLFLCSSIIIQDNSVPSRLPIAPSDVICCSMTTRWRCLADHHVFAARGKCGCRLST